MAIIGGNFNSFGTLGLQSAGTGSGVFGSSGLPGVSGGLGANQAQDLSQMMLQALTMMSGGWGSMLSGGTNNYADLESLATPLSSQYSGLTGVTDVNTMIAQMNGMSSSTTTTTGTGSTMNFANLDSSYYTQLMSGFDSQLNAMMAQYGSTG